MTPDDQNPFLGELQKALAKRPNNRAITSIVARYIHLINECMDYGYSRKEIYEIIFSEKDKEIISLKYFNDNVLYRARKKFNSKLNKINRSVNNEEKQHEINTIVKNDDSNASTMNAFEKLKARQSKSSSVIHNSGSTKEDLENTLARIMNKQES